MPQLDHRALVAGLSDEHRAGLVERSDRAGLIHLAGHLALIAVPAALIAAEVPGWPLLLVPLGIAAVFLFSAQHESAHGTAFRSEWVNRWVAAGCGFVLVLPPSWFRYFHFAHHRHTHDRARDPELAREKPRTVAQYALVLSGLPAWRGQALTLVRSAAGLSAGPYVPPRGVAKVVREARAMLAGYAALAAGSAVLATDVLLWIWVVPLLLGQPVLRAYLLAEHGGCPPVADMLANSRTTFTNSLVRFLAWNMPYHAEHHAHPAVPFHRLPAFHALAAAHLKTTERGYRRFHACYVAGLG
jgi:fatty acid desaturase